MFRPYFFPLRFWPAVILSLLIGGLLACSRSPLVSFSEIRIGVIAPLTGDSDARWGKSYVNGAMLAASRINDRGGLEVEGRKVKVVLTFADSQGNPQVALNVARKLIAQYNVTALVGAPHSQVAIPVAALAEIQNIPFITSMATHPDVTAGKTFTFRTIFSDTFQATALARFAVGDLGVKKAAVLFEVTNGDSSSLAGRFKRQFEALGGQVVAFEPYISGEKAWTSQLEAIRESGAQLLFLPNYGNVVPLQAKLARKAGIDIPLMGGDDWWGVETGKDRLTLEGGFFSTDYVLDLGGLENRAFLAAYRDQYKVDPNDDAAHIYDALGLLFTVVEAQGSTDPEFIRAGLAAVRDYAGVTGMMQFQGSGDPVKSVEIIQIRQGHFVRFKRIDP